MDAQVARPLQFSNLSPHYESPLFTYQTCGLHNPSVNGAKLYERTRIKTLTEERERIQKKTFTKWSNTFLRSDGKIIEDLFTDLCDGRILLKLIERVSGYKLPTPTPGRMRIHCLENVEKSLAFLDKLNVHLENIGAHDIVDGNNRIILGLIWTIILRFQIQNISVIEKVRHIGYGEPVGFRRNSTEALLLWCKAKTQGYPNVTVSNFTTSWRDGLAFNALIHKHRPDLIDFSSLLPEEPLRNLHIAFTTAERCLGIAKLLDPEDVMVEEPEEKSIITYLVSYYHYFAREKANTVHARRIERVVNLLRRFINDVKDYELSAEELLKWINEAISRMDAAISQGNLQDFQHQLIEMSRFRTQEKPPHFYEKGELEVNFLVIKNEMLAAGMRAYIPPKQIRISKINNAWEILEHCEYRRWLNLNDELRNQEMLGQLFLKFEKKCAMREAWLLENQQIAEQELIGSTRYALQVALKKHEAFEADVLAYEDRIEMLVQIADELKRWKYFREHVVHARSQQVTKQWQLLLDTINNRRIAIEQKISYVECDLEFDHFIKVAADLKKTIEKIDPGSDFKQTQDALMRMEAVDKETEFLCIQMHSLLLRHRDSHTEKLENEWAGMAEQVMLSSAQKRRELELAEQQWHLFPDISRYTNYVQNRLLFLESLEFQFSYEIVNRIHRQVRYIEEDIAKKKNCISMIEEISNRSDFDHQVHKFIASWQLLIQLINALKDKTVFVGDILFLKGEMDDAEAWITEKSKTLALNIESIESSVHLNQKLLEEVEVYQHVVEHITEKAMTLKQGYEDLGTLPEAFTTNFDAHILLQSLFNVRSGVEYVLTVKAEGLFQSYLALVENVKKKQASLIDALSVKQFLHNSDQARAWIVDKASLLDRLMPTDLNGVPEEGASPAVREQFDFFVRRFDEIESHMNDRAENVTNINKTASHLLDAAKVGNLQCTKDVVAVVTEARNQLNNAWNQLADRVEDCRYKLNMARIFLDLYQDCFYTDAWIEEKLASLSRHNWDNIPSELHLSRLNMVLKSLNSDAKVIGAKVDDIGERVAASRRIQSVPSDERSLWLTKEHESLLAKLAKFHLQLDQCESLLAMQKSHFQSAHSLEDFLQWVSNLKCKHSCIVIPSGLEAIRTCLSAEEQDLQELLASEKHLEELLAVYEKLPQLEHTEPPLQELHVNPELVIEEYAETCDLIRKNISELNSSIATQDLFVELGSLEAAVYQQDAYLNQEIRQESLESAETAVKEHEAFIASLLVCFNRLDALERRSCGLLTGDHNVESRLLSKIGTIREKLEQNRERAHKHERLLKENLRLQELLNDFADIEDWMSEKTVQLNQVTLTSKRDVSRAYAQVKGLQEEIEASRERAEGVIDAGKQLIDSCPHTSRIVTSLINDIYVHWEALLKQLHDQMLSLEESHREYLLNEMVHDLLRWAENLLSKIRTDIEDPDLTVAGLTDLQRRMEYHQRDCQDFENYVKVAGIIKEHTEALSQRYADRAADFAAVNAEVGAQMDAVEAGLARREDLLNLHTTVAIHLLDLNSELLWVKDKLVQIRRAYDDWTPQDRRSVGKQLLSVQQEKRRLMNHIGEVENRGPRVKNLCLRVKATYLAAGDGKGGRIGSFRDVLGELEQAWYTVTHLLEVRREELRLAEAIHRYFFDLVNMEAWISERELHLQSIDEPNNIAEANRALRRLNVLFETVNQWSDELVQIERRGNELCVQLSTGVQINGNYVIAPPVAKSAVAIATPRLAEAFSQLRGRVLDRRQDLLESIGLHDLIQDVNDLEEWIADRQKTANSSDVGTDLEQTFKLCDRFEQFAACTRREGERRMKAMLLRIDQMIIKGHKNRSDIALAKDGLNEDWADLLEMIATRWELLKSTLTLHRFFSDSQCLEKQIEECYQYLPEEPTVEMVTGRAPTAVQPGSEGGVANLWRRQAGLQLKLAHLNSSCSTLAAHAAALLPIYAGEAETQLRIRRDCVLRAAQDLAATVEARAQQLEEAKHFHRFFSTANSLLSWLAQVKDKMSQPNGLSRTIYGVERLIADHRQVYSELNVKIKQVEECLDIGRAILGIGDPSAADFPKSSLKSRLHGLLTTPQGEVRETCVALATERILAEALWRERWERLVMLLDARYYLRDAAAAESWLSSREVYLISVRRSIGETLAETLALLGAHYAFERACASADERFSALKRLTKMEIHALEWKREDGYLHEKQQRESIRRAVHEFLPPSDTAATLPPQAPPIVHNRDQHVQKLGASKEFDRSKPLPLADQGPRTSFSPPTSPEMLSHNPNSRASLPAVAVGTSRSGRHKEPTRPLSSSNIGDIFFPRRARVASPNTPPGEPVALTKPFGESEEGKTAESTSSTRPQGSFPSISAHTPPETGPEAVGAETMAMKRAEEFPRVEGPLIRKWEYDAGGTRHSRGRGWVSIYVTLMDGNLTFYKDRRTRREQEGETLHGEVPMELGGAIAIPALDYTKRPFVFRLRLLSGAEYLFQAVSAEVLQRWVDAINESASKLTIKGLKGKQERAHSLPTSARHSRPSVVSGVEDKSQKPRHSSLRRILKRN